MQQKYSLVVILLLFTLLPACSDKYVKNGLSADSNLYTAYNFWFENPDKISSLNYKRGGMIPAGTEVTNIEIGSHRRYRTIAFYTVNPERKFRIFWKATNHPSRTVEQFADELFGAKSLTELTHNLSKEDIDNIETGHISEGMAKNAVLVAYGPPPEKVTFSQKSDIWTYWTSRMVTTKIFFDENDMVAKMEKPEGGSGGGWQKFLPFH